MPRSQRHRKGQWNDGTVVPTRGKRYRRYNVAYFGDWFSPALGILPSVLTAILSYSSYGHFHGLADATTDIRSHDNLPHVFEPN